VTRLSKAADAGVLIVGYRKLPSHQIVDAIDDGICGLRWLQGRGYDADRVVVAGDSAGGYLAFMTTLAAIGTQVARPAGVATISPFTDADPGRKLKHRNARKCSMFPAGALSIFARYISARFSSGRPGEFLGVRCLACRRRFVVIAAGHHPRQFRRIAAPGRRTHGGTPGSQWNSL
jgi:acetyl esterase/lipase